MNTNLNTNEVRNAAGTEKEYLNLSIDGRTHEWALKNEVPNLPDRVSIKHTEIGTGLKLRRRSVLRNDLTIAGADSEPVKCTGYVVVDWPVGNLANMNGPKEVLAGLATLLGSAGSATVLVLDGTAPGAAALLDGSN